MRATGQTSKKHTAAFSDISAAAGERGLKKAYLRRVEGRLSRGVHLADINYTHTRHSGRAAYLRVVSPSRNKTALEYHWPLNYGGLCTLAEENK